MMTVFPESLQGRGEILQPCEVIHVPPLLRHFVAKNSFIPDRYNGQKLCTVAKTRDVIVLTEDDVKIARLDKSFEAGFLTKVEAPERGGQIESFELLRSLSAQEIADAYGNDICPMPLNIVFWLMSLQPNSVESGYLHSKGQDNIFLCSNVHDVPEVLLVRTGISGWEIRCEPCDQKRSYWGKVFFGFDTK